MSKLNIMAGNNITYLFGAGASFNAIPLVKEFPKEIDNFRNWVGNTKLNSQSNLNEIRDKFIDDITMVHRRCKDHYSIDTFAKKLSLRKQYGDLNVVKRVLDAFLIYYQFHEYKVDNRYDAFIAGIMQEAINDELLFPSNVKILSWNYDIQFELASRNYFDELGSEKLCRERLQMIPNQTNYKIVSERFSYIKLNGTSGAEIIDDRYQRKWQDFITFIDSPSEEGLLTQIMHSYCVREQNKIVPAITFAWENSPMSIYTLECAKDVAEITNTLVVIGYSFPSFNRSIDKSILGMMENLDEIIIQIPKDDIEEVSLKVKNIVGNDISIISYPGVQEFFIPNTFFRHEVIEIKVD